MPCVPRYLVQDCWSGRCRAGRCCAESVDASCAGCNADDGRCTSCAPRSVLINGVCAGPAGTQCSSHAHCISTACRGGFCCSPSQGPQCIACGSATGACASCASGFFLTSDTATPECVALLPGGAACTSWYQCASRSCQGGHCCLAASAACQSCDTTGSCTDCSGFELVQGVCQGPAGATCSSHLQCRFEFCRPAAPRLSCVYLPPLPLRPPHPHPTEPWVCVWTSVLGSWCRLLVWAPGVGPRCVCVYVRVCDPSCLLMSALQVRGLPWWHLLCTWSGGGM